MSESGPVMADEACGPPWQRWQMANLGARDRPAPPPGKPVQAPPVHAPDPEAELRAAQALARESGYAQGHEQGLAEGIETGQRQGRETGYQAGFSCGLSAGRGQALDAATQIRLLADTICRALEAMEAEAGAALVDLAIAIARQVLRGTLAESPEAIQSVVHEILQMDAAKGAEILLLRLNPADHALVGQYLSDHPGAGAWSLLADAAIQRGGCIAETNLGSIDATLQTRWKKIMEALERQHPWEPDHGSS